MQNVNCVHVTVDCQLLDSCPDEPNQYVYDQARCCMHGGLIKNPDVFFNCIRQLLGKFARIFNLSTIQSCKLDQNFRYWWSAHKIYCKSFLASLYVWPHEFVRFQDAEVVLARAFADYNNDRIHSTLGYVTPNEFARKVESGNK